MLFAIFIVLLLILVVWFGSTSYAPKLMLNYAYLSFASQHPQMEMEISKAGIGRWQLASIATKKEFAEQLNYEVQLAEKQMEAGRKVSSGPAPTPAHTPAPTGPVPTPNSAAPAAPAVPVVVPAAAPKSAATAVPTPVVEKFRTNLAHTFGSMRA